MRYKTDDFRAGAAPCPAAALSSRTNHAYAATLAKTVDKAHHYHAKSID